MKPQCLNSQKGMKSANWPKWQTGKKPERQEWPKWLK